MSIAQTDPTQQTPMLDTWTGCYNDRWQGIINDDAVVHPAKFSRGLIRRIYDHCVGEGWLSRGDHVIDPFGGVGLGALDAMRVGCHWTGVELERRFCDLGQGCDCAGFSKTDWKRFAHRADRVNHTREFHWCPGCLATMKHPPPLLYGSLWGLCREIPARNRHHYEGNVERWISAGIPDTARIMQGDSRKLLESVGNLAAMPTGSFEACVSSPPYAETRVGQESGQEHCGRGDQYGAEPGQLGAMREFQARVSSPPFESSLDNILPRSNDSGDTFWTAARQIVCQVRDALCENGHAVWVVKDYVKGGQRVPFCDNWRALCESVGFRTLHEHHAMLVSESPGQITIDGEVYVKKTARKSFFRRLAESKGSPRIDWETVLCMVKS